MSSSTAIDLYSGIGGWSLGLSASGVSVLGAFEWWEPAVRTYAANLGHNPVQADIRELDFNLLPKPGTVDLVVGSPPCTQFSYANRGGNGDLADGLKDVQRFMEIVDYLKPRHWAMENVPRLAGIVSTELGRSGKLSKYRDWITQNEVFLLSDYGIPQKRSRCLLGSFPVGLLKSYKGYYTTANLGELVRSLNGEPAIDPIYGMSTQKLTDHSKETYLSDEELRLNRAAKCFHPVYNVMSFPDVLERPARTITATCTRVSRESIIIRENNQYRRLTLRERACAQSFPITYQFLAKSYSQRMKMIGNALPPLFAYQVVQCLLEQEPRKLLKGNELVSQFHLREVDNTSAKPEGRSSNFRASRNFCFAIPGLRFGSGVRFELSNEESAGHYFWRINFVYGTSRNIIRGDLNLSSVENSFRTTAGKKLLEMAVGEVDALSRELTNVTGDSLQRSWTRAEPGYSPLDLLEKIGMISNRICTSLNGMTAKQAEEVTGTVLPNLNRKVLSEQSKSILTGIVIAAVFNELVNLATPGTPIRRTRLQPSQPLLITA